MAADFSARGNHRFRQSGCALRLGDSLGVRLAVDKFQGVGRDNFGVQLFAVSIVKQLLEPFVSAEAKVMTAVHANLERLFQFLLVEVLAAFFAAHKDIFSPDDALRVAHRLDLAFLFAKPGHISKNRSQKSETRSQCLTWIETHDLELMGKRVAQKAWVTEPGAVEPCENSASQRQRLEM